jgi:SpoVK/Ycf46/Vps4 family AAA+-type ATPase
MIRAEAKRHEIVKWLSPVDYRADQEIATKKHEDKTGEWFTKSYQYKKWTNEPNSFLWLYGIPGSGKTILS